ncbi:hypothetical protein LCGC14_0858510 [marine sediment metagenome]|uniref:Uncharacterized protein n=1 Tax=marine sediment metagenome TaxID=412755 RepID=A0A0F9PD02_9ZZZZ
MSQEESFRSLYLGEPFRQMPEQEYLIDFLMSKGEALKNGLVTFNRGFGWYVFDEVRLQGRDRRHDWGVWELSVTNLRPTGSLWVQEWWRAIYMARLQRASLADPIIGAGRALSDKIELMIDPAFGCYLLHAHGLYGNHSLVWPGGKHNLVLRLGSPIETRLR